MKIFLTLFGLLVVIAIAFATDGPFNPPAGASIDEEWEAYKVILKKKNKLG